MDRHARQQDGNILSSAHTVHFVGIGGVGMSGIAEGLLEKGRVVTGSDVRPSDLIDSLRSRGARVEIGHSAENVGTADLVVATSAARADNPELREARRRGIPV